MYLNLLFLNTSPQIMNNLFPKYLPILIFYHMCSTFIPPKTSQFGDHFLDSQIKEQTKLIKQTEKFDVSIYSSGRHVASYYQGLEQFSHYSFFYVHEFSKIFQNFMVLHNLIKFDYSSVLHFNYPFIIQWTLKLIPFPRYCEYMRKT